MTADRRGRLRRPSVHRKRPAPVSPAEVLERDPANVSRETLGGPMGLVAGGVPPLEDPPPLRRDQIARLEALTAVWTRNVRVGGPGPDDTLLLPSAPPPPPARTLAAPADPVRAVFAAADAAAAANAGRHAAPPTPTTGPDPDPAGPSSDTTVRVDAPTLSDPAAGFDVPARRVSDWASRHDPRSLEYAARTVLSRTVALRDVSLDSGPVLDQGTTPPLTPREASACVGMASTVAANVIAERAGQPGELDETAARELYAVAQTLDHVAGDYPGTSVLAGMKAGVQLGHWGSYLWALGGTSDVAQVLLQLGLAVVVGVPWDEGCETPDQFGVITPGGASLGGHAVAVVGLRMALQGPGPGPYFELQQSRGVGEGVAGHVFVHHKHLAAMLAHRGEAAVPLPPSGL